MKRLLPLCLLSCSLAHAQSELDKAAPPPGGFGIPIADGDRISKEMITVLALGSIYDPSTILGRTQGILDTSLKKLNINQEELNKLTDILTTFGQAVDVAQSVAGTVRQITNPDEIAANLARQSDAQERAMQVAIQQARAMGIDPAIMQSIRELNNQVIRNSLFAATLQKVNQLSGKNMSLVQRGALRNTIDQLNIDMMGQAAFNALVAASIKSMQSLDEQESLKRGQGTLMASAYTGAQVDGSLDTDEQVGPSQRPNRNYSFQGSEHIYYDDYKAALSGLNALNPIAGAGTGSLVGSAYEMIGTSTAGIPGTDGGNLGCAAAVSMMFKNATGQDILTGQSLVLGTGELYSGLSNDSRFVKVPLSQAQPGDIVVTARGNRPGHTGIVGNGGEIISNSSGGFNGSAPGTIQQNYTVAKWQSQVAPRNPGQTAAFRYIGG